MENFTPCSAFSGGIIMGSLMNASRTEVFWRIAFLAGIIIGAFLFNQIRPDFYQPRENFSVTL
jgi:hypothetical protein